MAQGARARDTRRVVQETRTEAEEGPARRRERAAQAREREAQEATRAGRGHHRCPKKSCLAPGHPAEHAGDRRERLMSAALEVMPTTGVVAVLTALGLSVATFYRAKKLKAPTTTRPTPARALSMQERQSILDVLHEERFRDLPPAEIVTTLLGEGRYLASERTLYRVLADNAEVRERRNQLTHPAYAKPELVATGPNQVYSWDITKLLTFEKFVYLYLYVVMDIFSRYVVGWMLADRENATLATRLIDETMAKHDVKPGEIILHADRGGPMRSKLLAELLAKLDAGRSFSRPHTSNDNPFSESAFKTLKYHPTFPKKFHGDVDGRAFCQSYFSWYNNEHHHSGIALLTPADVHFGRADEVLKRRHGVKLDAFHAHP
ncbi:MAG TPA: IS3 family transposase, partial [Myxococcota bacterium]